MVRQHQWRANKIQAMGEDIGMGHLSQIEDRLGKEVAHQAAETEVLSSTVAMKETWHPHGMTQGTDFTMMAHH